MSTITVEKTGEQIEDLKEVLGGSIEDMQEKGFEHEDIVNVVRDALFDMLQVDFDLPVDEEE